MLKKLYKQNEIEIPFLAKVSNDSTEKNRYRSVLVVIIIYIETILSALINVKPIAKTGIKARVYKMR